MKRITPTLWLSFGLTAFTLSVTLLAYTVGLLPDGQKVALDSRAKVAESLAIQLVNAVNRQDANGLEEVLKSVVSRNGDVLSGAIRQSDGALVFAAGDHEKHWKAPPQGKSTPTHVTVPLIGKSGQQGSIELAFVGAEFTQRILGIPATMLVFLVFLAGLGFVGYFILLRRTLRQLDPGRVIPERVQKAFDTLNEGVIIVDEKQRMLLINKSFARTCGDQQKLEVGGKINRLGWRMVDGRAKAGGFPWYTAIKQGQEVSKDLLSLRTAEGEIVNFNVSATVIASEKGKTIGAIITLSDLTQSKRLEDEFDKTVEKLSRAEEEAQHYRQELEYAKTHDVLTGCLNRQAFMREMETRMNAASQGNQLLSTICFKIDQLAEINQTHGIALADKLLVAIADSLESVLGGEGFIGRFNAGTFGIALPGRTSADAQAIAQEVRQVVDSKKTKFLPEGEAITLSLGLAQSDQLNSSAHGLMNRTLLALDKAKSSGGGKVIEWKAQAPANAGEQAQSPALHRGQKRHGSSASTGDREQHSIGQLAAESAVELKYFLDSVDHALQLARDNNSQLAIVQIAIDSWDYLSEAVGIFAIEKLLAEINRRCSHAVRASDHLVSLHHSGDILIRLAEVESISQIERMLDQIFADLAEPVTLGDQQIYVTANAGIAQFPQDGATSTILLRNAGTAMRRAKNEGLAKQYRSYAVDMIQSSQERLLIESGIREALTRNEFELYFQPIIDAQTGAISAAECLLRSSSPRLKGFRIDEIVTIAEMSSLSLEIDKWVLETALAQMQIWDETGIVLPKISINISAHQLTNIVFMDFVYATIYAAPFAPQRVQIEVTETAKMAGVEIAASQIKRLQQLGVIIALDDFGTGQASLTYLQRLHPDIVKIDRSFVDGVHTNHANATLVSATTVMAHSLGLKVVAEGVELEGELEFLCNIGCDELQGYLFAKPMPQRVMTDWIKNSNLRATRRQQNGEVVGADQQPDKIKSFVA